jgi:hypothetical protein
MKVYWAPLDQKDINFTLAYYPPSRLPNEIPTNIKNSNFYKCPAFTDTIKNTFALKSPFELTAKFNPSLQQASSNYEDLFNHKVNMEDTNLGIIQFYFSYIFFSEKPLKITQMHPYLHHNTFTENGNGLLGEYDCGQWLRPLMAPYILDPKKQEYNYNIKRGDIYSYIRFNTEEKVELVNFEPTQRINDIIKECLNLKTSSNKTTFSLNASYKQFMLYRRKQAIMQEIKAQGLI